MTGDVAKYAKKVEDKFREFEWVRLDDMGFNKKHDYCFIYSYPPVRALDTIAEKDLFLPSEYGSISDCANLYIHIPYCTGICSYCYFAKVVSGKTNPVLKQDYPKTLQFEMERILHLSGANPEILSIHIGGGTPFLLNLEEISEVMSFIRKLKLSRDIEVTIESSPETVKKEPEKLKAIQELGINRINLGVESLSDHVLRLMNRRHSSATTLEALDMILESGFENVNVDVIYGLPGETLETWINTLLLLERKGVHSISAYRLRKHPGKKISKIEEASFPSYDETLKMQLAHGTILLEKQFVRSSSHKYARGKKKLQNQIELKRGTKNNQLISLGCGAYGFINGTFYWNTHSLETYAEKINNKTLPVQLGQVLSKEELMRKAMVLGMHTNSGVSLRDFQDTFGVDPQVYFDGQISKMRQLGLIDVANDHVVPTEVGRFFADEISVEYYSQDVKARLAKAGMKYGMFWEHIHNT